MSTNSAPASNGALNNTLPPAPSPTPADAKPAANPSPSPDFLAWLDQADEASRRMAASEDERCRVAREQF